MNSLLSRARISCSCFPKDSPNVQLRTASPCRQVVLGRGLTMLKINFPSTSSIVFNFVIPQPGVRVGARISAVDCMSKGEDYGFNSSIYVQGLGTVGARNNIILLWFDINIILVFFYAHVLFIYICSVFLNFISLLISKTCKTCYWCKCPSFFSDKSLALFIFILILLHSFRVITTTWNYCYWWCFIYFAEFFFGEWFFLQKTSVPQVESKSLIWAALMRIYSDWLSN